MNPGVDIAEDMREAIASGLRPVPRLTVSEWADKYRRLPDTSAEPGRWRTSRTPYLREPQDLLSAAATSQHEVVVMKGSQLGFSEMLNNVIGYSVHQDPCPILMVQPTEATAEKYSKKRIAPMLEASPWLRELVATDRTRSTSNTLLNKEFRGGALTLVGSNAPAGLASLAIRRALLDEVDRFSRDAGGEGDVASLVRARLSTFADWQLVMVSTPTVAGESLIAAAYEDSDQRIHELPCPHCGTLQELRWAQIRWPKGDPGAAEYYCLHCKEAIDEAHKPWMLDNGEWRATNAGHAVAGFRISGLCSPWVSWRQIVAEFVAAMGSPQKLQVWVNTRLGEVWDPLDSADIDELQLVALRELYDVPAGVIVVTAAVDVQDDRFEIEFSGWGAGEERWHLDLVVVTGDPSAPAVWADLDRQLLRAFSPGDGRKLPVAVALIDSGGHHTLAVYDFCRARHGRRVYAIKGSSDPKRSPLWPRRPSKSAKGGNCPIYMLGVSVGKDATRASLLATMARRAPDDGSEPETSGPGLIHWPISAAYGRAYFEQLTSETPLVKFRLGRPMRVWTLRPGHRNEALDLDVYGLAALHAWKALGYRLDATAAAQQRPSAPRTQPRVAARAPARGTARKLPNFWRR